MENKIFEKVNLPVETRQKLFRNLMCAVLLEAAKDYCGEAALTNQQHLPRYIFDKDTIIEDLKSERMRALTDGMSVTVADVLLEHGGKVKANLQEMVEDFQLIKVDNYDKPQYR